MTSLRTRALMAASALVLKRPYRDGDEVVSRLRNAARWLPALPMPNGIRRRHTTLGGVHGCWYEPRSPKGSLLYLHGGAFVCGLTPPHRHFAAVLAGALQRRVFLADYRLAPEHPFPAAAQDSLAAYRAITQMFPAQDIVVAGDSAGGALTLVTLMQARDEGLKAASCAISFSPVTGTPEAPFASRASNEADDCMISQQLVTLAIDAYLAGGDENDWRALPLSGDFTNLPPILMMASESECLFDDSAAVVEKIRMAGGISEFITRPGLPHVWPIFQALLPEAREDLPRIVEFVRRHAQKGRPRKVDAP